LLPGILDLTAQVCTFRERLVFFVALRMLEDLSMLDVEQWENITGSENPPSSTDQQQTPNNKVTMTEMTMALAEQKIR
jgi:hypothetical protein